MPGSHSVRTRRVTASAIARPGPLMLALAPALLLLSSAAPLSAQGATGFLRGEGHFDTAFSFAYEDFDHFWVGNNKVSSPMVKTVKRYSWNLWMAYGITDNLDVSLNASYVDATSTGPMPDNDDFQDLVIGAKWRPCEEWRLGPGSLALLVAPAVKTPLTNYEDNFLTAIGDGQTDIRLRGIAQYTFDFGVWLAVESGYDVRFDSPHDETPINFTVGGTIEDTVTLTAFYSQVISFGGYDIGEGSFPGVQEEYKRIGATAYVRITDNFGLTASAYTTLDGKNTGDTDGFSAGFVVRF